MTDKDEEFQAFLKAFFNVDEAGHYRRELWDIVGCAEALDKVTPADGMDMAKQARHALHCIQNANRYADAVDQIPRIKSASLALLQALAEYREDPFLMLILHALHSCHLADVVHKRGITGLAQVVSEDIDDLQQRVQDLEKVVLKESRQEPPKTH